MLADKLTLEGEKKALEESLRNVLHINDQLLQKVAPPTVMTLDDATVEVPCTRAVSDVILHSARFDGALMFVVGLMLSQLFVVSMVVSAPGGDDDDGDDGERQTVLLCSHCNTPSRRYAVT